MEVDISVLKMTDEILNTLVNPLLKKLQLFTVINWKKIGQWNTYFMILH